MLVPEGVPAHQSPEYATSNSKSYVVPGGMSGIEKQPASWLAPPRTLTTSSPEKLQHRTTSRAAPSPLLVIGIVTLVVGEQYGIENAGAGKERNGLRTIRLIAAVAEGQPHDVGSAESKHTSPSSHPHRPSTTLTSPRQAMTSAVSSTETELPAEISARDGRLLGSQTIVWPVRLPLPVAETNDSPAPSTSVMTTFLTEPSPVLATAIVHVTWSPIPASAALGVFVIVIAPGRSSTEVEVMLRNASCDVQS